MPYKYYSAKISIICYILSKYHYDSLTSINERVSHNFYKGPYLLRLSSDNKIISSAKFMVI